MTTPTLLSKALSFGALAGMIFLVSASPARAEQDKGSGAQLPSGVQRVGKNRYRSPLNFKDTLKYYGTVYPSKHWPRRWIANQPEVKAIHIQNPSGRNFDGLNIYEANDEVRIYVVPPTPKPLPTKG